MAIPVRSGAAGGAAVLRAGLALLLLTAPAWLAAQGTPAGDVLRGRVVTSDSTTPVAGVEVSARSVRTLAARSATTDADGRFTLQFPDTSAAYELLARRIGFTVSRLRLERDAAGRLVVPLVVLGRQPQLLEGVDVRGRRPPVGYGIGVPRQGVAGRESRDYGYEVSPDLQGTLDAYANSALGATLLTDANGNLTGFSVGGAAPEQNNVTLDGTTFGGPGVPAFSLDMTQATTATYDAARGQFSGGQVRAGMRSGSELPQQRFRLLLQDPALQLGDRAAARLGGEYRNVVLNTSFEGPLPRRWQYAVATDLNWRTTPLRTVLDADAGALRALGLAADSVARLRRTLDALGVPLSTGGVPEDVRTRGVNTIAKLTARGGGRSESVTELRLEGNWSDRAGLGIGPSAFPAAGGRQVSAGGGLFLSHIRPTSSGILNDTRTYLSSQQASGEPYLAIPAATVRIPSLFEGGDGGVGSVRFGGNTRYPTGSRTTFWETQHETSWRTFDKRHHFKAAAMVHGRWFDQTAVPNRLGTFTYNALADLDAGRPASFTRTLDAPARGASTWRGALSFGDVNWHPSPNVHAEYGLRLDAARIGGLPSYDPRVDALFGRRTDRVPDQLGLSPRAGLVWRPGNQYSEEYWTRTESDSRSELRIGAGLFRDVIDPADVALAGAAANARVLSCVGEAVPAPVWEQYGRDPSAVPAVCVAGAAGGSVAPFSGTAPDIAVFDPAFQAPYAWKGNVAWQGRVRALLRYKLDASYTRGLAERSAVDLNLRRTPELTLGDEGGRPVFSPASAFDPSTGAVSLLASRRIADYGAVTNVLSDAARDARQLSVRIEPVWRWYRAMYRLDYTWSRIRDQARGSFGGVTAGDPSRLAWGRSDYERRHQFQLTGQFRLGQKEKPHYVTAIARLYSGAPFTPIVAGDVNGDGDAFNDAAFVFDPARADPALAAGMRELLRPAPRGTRDCLRRQLGAIAGRNGCTGRWTGALDLVYTLRTPALTYLLPIARGDPFQETGGLEITLTAHNVLGGLDRLLHGSRGMRGWGDAGYVDPVLLSVRGFDPAARRFAYDVNPRFGASAAGGAAFRVPFRLTIGVSLNRDGNYSKQTVDDLRAQLKAPGQTLSPDRAADRAEGLAGRRRSYYIDWFLERRDLLLLTSEQVRAIEALQEEFGVERDSLAASLAAYLQTVTLATPWQEVYRRFHDAHEAVERRTARYMLRVRRLLSRDQWALGGPVKQQMAAEAEAEEKRQR